MRARWIATFVVLVCGARPALAQDTYVNASLTGDVVRLSASESAGQPGFSGGEAIGFALRAGTRLGTAWGVEAEFARPAEIEHEWSPDVIPLPARVLTFTGQDGTAISTPDLTSLIFPPRSYRFRTAYRDTTLSAAVWTRQDFSARFALVYIGGIGFHRAEQDSEITIDPFPFPVSIPGVPIVPRGPLLTEAATYRSKATIYSARPFAGIEARLRMTDRVELVPGVRVHGLDGGILVRPSVGLGWRF